MLRSCQHLILASCLLSHTVAGDWYENRAQDGSTEYIDRYVSKGTKQRMAWHQIAKFKDYLYIDGGQLSTYLDGNNTRDGGTGLETNRTLSIPLNEPWNSSTVEITELPYPEGDSILSTNFEGLWADEKRGVIYKWAGERPDIISWPKGRKNELFMLEADSKGTGNWTTKPPADQDAFNKILASTHGASVFCGDLGFYFGGSAYKGTGDNDLTGDQTTPGVRVFNASSAKWESVGSTDLSAPSGGIKGAEAVCIQGFGTSPLVLLLGGTDAKSSNYNDLDSVSIYDATQKKWHKQNTFKGSNGSPPGREAFCAAGALGKNGTFEVFVFGGQGAGKVLQDVWVLSLPSFRWFQLSAAESSRQYHRCVVAGKRQMISVGGLDESSALAIKNDDTRPRGIGIFDLVSLTWSTSYDPNLGEYDSPNAVKEVYQSGTAPFNYEYEENIYGLFWKDRMNNNSSNNNNTSNSNSSLNDGAGNNAKAEKREVSIGAIIGAVIGGVILVALAVGTYGFLRRRRQRKEREASRFTDREMKTDFPEFDETGGKNTPASYLPGSSSKSSSGGTELDSTALLEAECHRSAIRGALIELPQPVHLVELDAAQPRQR